MMVSGAVLVLGLGASAGAKATAVKVEINDDGCPAKLTVKAGPTNFKVSNTGSGDVSEFEILSGERIIGEVEPASRGPYCGAVGWVDAGSRSAELAVAIRTFTIAGGMCPRCEGIGTVSDIDLTQRLGQGANFSELSTYLEVVQEF